VQAAGDAAGDQRAFIQSMVDRLAARLKDQPEDPQGWARLIRAYGVLGETDRQKAAVAEVERRYASRPAIMRSILQGR
jgi:cytochrome c-type biogenesis protein CcmH